MADSSIVLVNGIHFQASLVESTANISRRDFLLDTKLTRVLLTIPINNLLDFGLRETFVLSQSENLALAEERLTVAVQKNNIFQEPISNNEIFLNQFITGLQAQQILLVSGKRIRAQINVGGFLRSLNWEPRNQGDHWNFSGLLDIDVKALAVNSQNLYVFAGTTSNGIFRSINAGDAWEQLLTEKLGTGEISSKGTTVTGVGTFFTRELTVGGTITVAEKVRIITGIASDTTLTVNNAFRPDLPLGTKFTVNTGLTSKNITALLAYTQPLKGTIAIDGITVVGVGTAFTKKLAVGEAIAANKQSRIVTSIVSDTSLTIDTPWDNLPAGSAFGKTYLFAGTAGSGIFRSRNNGETWELVSGEETALLENGAGLPSGQENVTATYSSGIGSQGNVSAESLTLLKTRPLGIQEATNPLPATGGAAKESLDTARSKAPATVRTLDRIVSLRDFKDFAATFAGIGKATSVALWNGNSHIVHITVAGSKGEIITTTSSLYANLLQAIDGARDPLQQVQVDAYEQLLFNLEATIQFDRRYKPDKLEAEIRQALSEKFAFANRTFGQGVNASEAIAFIQNITGVVAVDLDALCRQEFIDIHPRHKWRGF